MNTCDKQDFHFIRKSPDDEWLNYYNNVPTKVKCVLFYLTRTLRFEQKYDPDKKLIFLKYSNINND